MAREPRQNELTDEQIAAENAFLEGVPRLNLGAFLMPGIWGPAHGLWICILFYPLWLFADNTFYAAFSERPLLAVVLAAIVFVMLLVVHVVFGILSQPFAWHRADGLGVDKQTYLKREKIWAVAMALVSLTFVVVATYYNLVIRPGVGA